MRALTIAPGQPGSAEVHDIAEPAEADGPVLVQTLAIGICGTNLEISAGEYGEAPAGEQRLVLGHESIGRVLEAPADSGLSTGDLVAGIVRCPDPVPCENCAVGEWDMCRNGRYTEHGIKGLHGFARDRYRTHPDRVVPVEAGVGSLGVLLEPTSVVAKAWDHIERIGHRSRFAPASLLVTGAGPIGLLAALLGMQRGLDVHVLDRVDDGPKPALVRDLGATYHTGEADQLGLAPDIVIEATGVAGVVLAAMSATGPAGIVCLTGVSSTGRPLSLDVGGLNREIVLQNDVVFGSVNANRRHYEAAASALARADRQWLARLVTRRVPLDGFADALVRHPTDVKVVLQISPDEQ